ncbi:hypothetical protein SLT67_16435 [Paenibacillus illinoisensis]|uniref:hypothetical protein n=1 Tax=Paenibacillus illinoisensis TaxID=59845 RepID=UPI003CF6776F
MKPRTSSSIYTAKANITLEPQCVLNPDNPAENADSQLDVVSPCGICRELIGDYGQSTQVILQGEEGYTKTTIGQLLPQKYSRS